MMRGKFDEIGDGREVGARINVKSPVRVGRHVVTMSSRRSGGTDALGGAASHPEGARYR